MPAISSNVLDQKKTSETIRDTLQFLSDTLSKSLGPYGSTTIIQDRMTLHQISKDGYTIFSKIVAKNDLERTIVAMIQRIGRLQVRAVGDGSTSVVVAARWRIRT